MGYACCAYNCSNRNSKEKTFKFFHFPLKNKELTAKWVMAINRKNFNPTKHSVVCEEHFEADDFKNMEARTRRLKEDAFPTIIKGLSSPVVKKSRNTRSFLKVKFKTPVLKRSRLEMAKKNVVHDHDYYNPGKERKMAVQPDTTEVLRKKIQALQKQLRRKDEKLNLLKNSKNAIEEQSKTSTRMVEVFEYKFSGLPLELLKNEGKNQAVEANGRRYSDEIKKFALTLNYHSPEGYEYLRSHFSLPNQRTLRSWTSPSGGDPDLCFDVLRELQ